MTSSLVGSEMCIRDRSLQTSRVPPDVVRLASTGSLTLSPSPSQQLPPPCLLYTSDAADDM
eukprot:4719598-Prorocentrum_lima.AAC.1